MSDHSVVFLKHCFSSPPSLLASPCSHAEANAKAGASAATGASSEAPQGLDKRAAIFSMLNCKAKLDTQPVHLSSFGNYQACCFPVMMTTNCDKLTEKRTPEIIAQIYLSVRACSV